MALSRVKTWNPGDVLTASDLNGEFNNVLNNPITLVSPTTGPINFNLQAHSNLIPAALSASTGSTGSLLTVSTNGVAVWAAPNTVVSTAPRILQTLFSHTTGSNIASTSPGNMAQLAITPASTKSRIKILYSADMFCLGTPAIAQLIFSQIATTSGVLANTSRAIGLNNVVGQGVGGTHAWTYVHQTTGPYPTTYTIQSFADSSTGASPFGGITNVNMILEELSS